MSAAEKGKRFRGMRSIPSSCLTSMLTLTLIPMQVGATGDCHTEVLKGIAIVQSASMDLQGALNASEATFPCAWC